MGAETASFRADWHDGIVLVSQEICTSDTHVEIVFFHTDIMMVTLIEEVHTLDGRIGALV